MKETLFNCLIVPTLIEHGFVFLVINLDTLRIIWILSNSAFQTNELLALDPNTRLGNSKVRVQLRPNTNSSHLSPVSSLLPSGIPAPTDYQLSK